MTDGLADWSGAWEGKRLEDEGWAEDVSRHMKMGPRVQISVLYGNIHQRASSEEAQNNQVDEMTPSTDVSQPLSASFCQWCPGTRVHQSPLFTAKHHAMLFPDAIHATYTVVPVSAALSMMTYFRPHISCRSSCSFFVKAR